MKRKKGFTLIELIAAIAILAIAFTGISLALLASVKTEKKSDVKLETSTYAKAVVENIKIQSNDVLSKTTNVRYIFFDNKDSFENCLYNKFLQGLEGKYEPSPPTIDENNKTGKDVVNLPMDNTLCTYTKCNLRNTKENNRKYGACISTEYKELTKSSIVSKGYFVRVWVWSLQYGESSLSYREFYTSR